MIAEINSPGIAHIGNMMQCQTALERAIERNANLPGMVCFYGPSGWGKSLSSNYLCNQMRGYYIQVKSIWSKKVILQKILGEMGIKPAQTTGEMLDQVCDQLSASQRPLVIDEMDHVVDKKAVELVRDIYEGSQAPILIIGEENLPQKLKKWERFHGRILAFVPALPVDLEDARRLSSVYAPGIECADELLRKLVADSHGSVRRVCVNLDQIREAAAEHGAKGIDLGWCKAHNVTFYSGEAPKRRVV
ncbi:AAA family ATPase [Methylomonas sp. 2BW1-5-20]|uniref:AAA family ATPase n=1 Tax=Methylomonas sp. 2BW1-5-20 TaxID=3376686 RepID=UPI00404BF701